MHLDETNQPDPEVPDRERDPAGPVEPRGNPDTDQDTLEKGEEQLDKVSGN